MKKVVEVKGIKIGEGIPKICISIVGEDSHLLIEEINQVKVLEVDIVEWRIDYYKDIDNMEQVTSTLNQLRNVLGNMPLLVTFRSKKEGGKRELSVEEYINLNKVIIATGKADLIDVELFTGEDAVKEIISFAHKNNVKVVISNHDFEKTPSKEEIIDRLRKMQELDADLPKIAVMPQNPSDVLTLLSATNEMSTKYADRPIITMSMSRIGVVSRISGEIFGSALTFGAAKIASAPGQISITKLDRILHIIHES